MAFAKYYRWSDHDRRFGPFIYARDSKHHRPMSLMIDSGGREDSNAPCTLRIRGFGHTLIIAIPAIIKPWRHWVDLSNREWAKADVATGKKGYWDEHPREYGFSLSDGHLSVHFGAQTMDSSTTEDWGCFLPWTQWRHVRMSIYDQTGAHYWTEPKGRFFESWDDRKAAEKHCEVVFLFADYDGEELTVSANIEEREWRFGTGWFKWLSWFGPRKIRRSLDLRFSGETGNRKGSWKGGTLGHSINMLPGEMHEAAFRRYCQENRMTFITPAVLPDHLDNPQTPVNQDV